MVQENPIGIAKWVTGRKKDLSAIQETAACVRKADLVSLQKFPKLFSEVGQGGADERGENEAVKAVADEISETDPSIKQWWLSALDLGVHTSKLEKLQRRLDGFPRLLSKEGGSRRLAPLK